MKKTENKLINIKDIKFDEKLYPRGNPDYVTIARYVNAMKSGSVFPPITLAKTDKGLFIIDGKHRLEASKGCKETHIQAEVLSGLSEKEIFIEAVKRNSEHGKQFNTYDTTKIIIKLEEFELTPAEITELVRIPADNLKSFVAKRMTSVFGSNEEIPLKKPFSHLSQGEITIENNVESIQRNFNGTSQENLFGEVISLFKNNLLDIENPKVLNKVKTLKKILDKFEIPVELPTELSIKDITE